MSNLEQMEDNLETMSSFVPFTDGDRLVIDQVMDILSNIPVIPCTDCRYCLDGCPQQINIPGVFRLVNDYKVMVSHRQPQCLQLGHRRWRQSL